jgi:hypothetical protein
MFSVCFLLIFHTCTLLAVLETTVANDYSGCGGVEWNLPMRLWLSQLSLDVKKNIAEFLARELLIADNAFFRVNEQRCRESAAYCSRTYDCRLLSSEDCDDRMAALKAHIQEREGVLEQRQRTIELLLQVLGECNTQLADCDAGAAALVVGNKHQF